MIENPQNTPPDSSTQSPLSDAQCDALFSSWRVEVGKPTDASLERRIGNLATLFERSFGPTPATPWLDQDQRGKMLVLFLCAVDPNLFKQAWAQRASIPIAETLFARINAELREAIPKLDTERTASLLGSGYPMEASDPDSLAQLCITHELSQRGSTGLLGLLSRCGGPTQLAKQSWAPNLIRAANVALSEATPENVRSYIVGLKHFFPPKGPWVSQAKDLFAGMSTKVPIDILVDAYSRARLNNRIALPVKEALLYQVIDALAAISGVPLPRERATQKKSSDLPIINAKTAAIAKEIQKLKEKTTERTEALRKILGEQRPETEDVKETAPPTPISDQKEPQKQSKKKPKSIGAALSTLKGEGLTSFLTTLIEEGLRDPSSELSERFGNCLTNIPIENLLLIRRTLAGSENIPPSHLSAVEERIQGHLTKTLPKLRIRKLFEKYKLLSDSGVTREELRPVIGAIRERLKLPRRDEEPENHQCTAAGLRVWRWVFPKGPPDATLISDFVTTHFNRLVAQAASEISLEHVHDLALDHLLEYARELSLPISYTPHPQLTNVETWKLFVLTSHVRRANGIRDTVVDSLVESIATCFVTRDADWRDAFPQDWTKYLNPTAIHTVTSEVSEKLRSRTSELSFEGIMLLLNNIQVMGRRGPSPFTQVSKDAQKRFHQEFPRLTPDDLRDLDQRKLTRIIHSMDAARYRALHVLGDLADECVKRASLFSPDDFADIAVAFANLRAGSPEFWSTLTARVEREWDAFNSEKILARLWGIVVMAPELTPSRFDASVLKRCSVPSSRIKIAQSLIALGRYSPGLHDRVYTRLLKHATPHRQLTHEKVFNSELPEILGMPPESIFSQVVVGGFETDFVVDFGRRRLIIELDGEQHFLSGPDGGMRHGRDEFQDKVFRWLGYQVFHLPTSTVLDSNSRQRLISELGALAKTLKQEAADPSRPRRVYLEDLRETRGGDAQEERARG